MDRGGKREIKREEVGQAADLPTTQGSLNHPLPHGAFSADHGMAGWSHRHQPTQSTSYLESINKFNPIKPPSFDKRMTQAIINDNFTVNPLNPPRIKSAARRALLRTPKRKAYAARIASMAQLPQSEDAGPSGYQAEDQGGAQADKPLDPSDLTSEELDEAIQYLIDEESAKAEGANPPYQLPGDAELHREIRRRLNRTAAQAHS